MRGAERRWSAGLLLARLLVGLAGCATMCGLGENIQSFGRGIKKVFTPEPPSAFLGPHDRVATLWRRAGPLRRWLRVRSTCNARRLPCRSGSAR